MKIQKLYEDTIGDIANKLENGEDAKKICKCFRHK